MDKNKKEEVNRRIKRGMKEGEGNEEEGEKSDI